MNTLFNLLGPLLAIVLGAFTAFLTKWLTNEAKQANLWLGNASPAIKQLVALAVSTIISVGTALTGLHLSGTSLGTLTSGDFSILVQALVGWIGSMTIYHSTSTTTLVSGIAPVPVPPVVVNIHNAGGTATPIGEANTARGSQLKERQKL